MPTEITTQVQAEIHINELSQIVESVFATMLGLEVRKGSASYDHDEDWIVSAVHLAGPWNGALLLECHREQACRLAGRFLSLDAPLTVTDDVRDVIGEITNMIGGNLKCVLTSGSRLSLPSVTDGSGFRVCGSRLQDRIAWDCEDGPFWITLRIMEEKN